MQIPCDLYAEVSQKSDLRSHTKGTQGCAAPIGGAEGVSDRGGAFDERSCAHDALDPAETCGLACCRFSQGKKLDLGGAKHRQQTKEFRRP